MRDPNPLDNSQRTGLKCQLHLLWLVTEQAIRISQQTKYQAATSEFNIEPATHHFHEPTHVNPLGSISTSRLFQPHPAAGERPDSSYTLATNTQTRMDTVLRAALADSTRNNYNSLLGKFFHFCDREQVPLHARLPAHENLLCAFASSLAGTHAKSSVRNNLSAIRAWHIIQGVTWKGGFRLAYILNGVERMQPDKKPPRPPVTRAMLEALYESLDREDPEQCCILAAAFTAFWTQSRLGELFATSSSSFDPKRIPARFHLLPASPVNGSRTLHYPYTKTRRYAGDNATVTRQLGVSDPIVALERHLQTNPAPPSAPLFSFCSQGGRLRYLTKKQFLWVCNNVWTKTGFAYTTGHSFRIGGTTELLLNGVDPDIVKKMGRWSSDSFLRYWRGLELIIPMHAQMLDPKSSTKLGKRKRLRSLAVEPS